MTEQPDSTGPRDDTARHDDAPDDIATSDSATRAGPAGDEAGQAETIAYSPPPEAHPEWANPVWIDPAGAGPPPAGEASTPAPTEPVVAATTTSRRRGPDGLGPILGAALLSAVLASS